MIHESTETHLNCNNGKSLEPRKGRVYPTYLVDSNGYVINLGSNGMSGSVLLYLTLQTSSDLQKEKRNIWSDLLFSTVNIINIGGNVVFTE